MRMPTLVLGICLSVILSGCSFLGDDLKINSEAENINLTGLLSIEPSVDVPNWKEQREDFSIIFTGDVMLGRYVETLMNRNGTNYPFEKVQDRLNLADEVVVNLEGPVMTSDKHVQTPDFSTNFSFDEDVLSVFDQNNIGVVNLSNNHTFDKGEDSFSEMISILGKNDLDWFGHPMEYDNKYVHTINANGVDVNLLGYHQATVGDFDIIKMSESIDSLARSNPGAINVVSLHFGPEYLEFSSDIQKKIARSAVEAGADMVIGHHPHVIHEMEVYHGVPIFYSLGNFIFDQYFSTETQEGLAVEMVIEFKELSEDFDFESDPYTLLGGKYEVDKVGLKLLPMKSVKSQPYFLGMEEYDNWIREFANKSKIGNIEADYFYEWSY